jgi:hypothetical protein
VGAFVLTVALVLVRFSLSPADSAARHLTLVAVLLGVLAIELMGRTYRLAGNVRVPASLVARTNVRSGFLWGTALGAGLVTEAPYGVLHASLAMAVLAPHWEAVVLVPLVFAVGRGLVTLPGWVRRRILMLTDRAFQLRGRSVSVGISVAVVASRISVAAALTATLLQVP